MSDQPPLDPAAIESLRALSPDEPGFLGELVEIYRQDTPQRLAELDAALAKKDGSALVRAAHTIKGSSGNFGATTLARLAQDLEEHGKSSDFAAAAAALPKFKAELARVDAALKILAGT